jgi:hypothetical protein
MEMSQGNSLESYRKQTEMPFFGKQNRKVKQVLSGGWYSGGVGCRGGIRNGCRR